MRGRGVVVLVAALAVAACGGDSSSTARTIDEPATTSGAFRTSTTARVTTSDVTTTEVTNTEVTTDSPMEWVPDGSPRPAHVVVPGASESMTTITFDDASLAVMGPDGSIVRQQTEAAGGAIVRRGADGSETTLTIPIAATKVVLHDVGILDGQLQLLVEAVESCEGDGCGLYVVPVHGSSAPRLVDTVDGGRLRRFTIAGDRLVGVYESMFQDLAVDVTSVAVPIHGSGDPDAPSSTPAAVDTGCYDCELALGATPDGARFAIVVDGKLKVFDAYPKRWDIQLPEGTEVESVDVAGHLVVVNRFADHRVDETLGTALLVDLDTGTVAELDSPGRATLPRSRPEDRPTGPEPVSLVGASATRVIVGAASGAPADGFIVVPGPVEVAYAGPDRTVIVQTETGRGNVGSPRGATSIRQLRPDGTETVVVAETSDYVLWLHDVGLVRGVPSVLYTRHDRECTMDDGCGVTLILQPIDPADGGPRAVGHYGDWESSVNWFVLAGDRAIGSYSYVDGDIEYIDLAFGDPLEPPGFLSACSDKSTSECAAYVAVNPDGRMAVSQGDGRILIVDGETGSVLRTLSVTGTATDFADDLVAVSVDSGESAGSTVLVDISRPADGITVVPIPGVVTFGRFSA